MSSINPIERISILSRLVLKYCGDFSFIDSVKLAKDLANTIDELNSFNISLKTLEEEFITFFPEHWKKRTQFLLIITKYWPEILSELNKEDVEKNHNTNYKFKCISKNIRKEIDIKEIKNKINIFNANDIYEEIDFIIQTIKNNLSKTISIVSSDASFSEVLYNRLQLEKIDFSSNFENFDRSDENIKSFLDNLNDLKNTENINQDLSNFLEEINKNFGDFMDVSEKDFRKLITLMLDFLILEKKKKNISIIKVGDIKYSCDDIIIATSLNMDSWKFKDKGGYWLHPSIRKKIGLPDPNSFKTLLEDDFYSLFNNISEVFLTRSSKINGSNCYKSSILSKFELTCKKQNLPLIYCSFARNFSTKNDYIQPKLVNSYCYFPHELSSKSIELLMQNPDAFYAKEILGLTPIDTDTKLRDLSIFFKNLMHSYFKKDQKAEAWLDLIKSIDFFNYQKCKNIINWLERRDKGYFNSFNNVKGAMNLNINNSQLTIFSFADRIEKNHDGASLITYKLSSSTSTKEILYGAKSSILTTCLIAKKGGFENLKSQINEIQIWSISAYEENPIDIKTLEINNDLIDNFEYRLRDVLNKYSQGVDAFDSQHELKQKFNRYKHFERK